MNLSQILGLRADFRRPEPISSTGGAGTLVQRMGLQRTNFRTRAPESFVPGFSHGNKNDRKRKRRTRGKLSARQKLVADVMQHGHQTDKQKMLAQMGLSRESEKVVDYMNSIMSGKQASTEVVRAPKRIKIRKKPETPEERLTEERTEEKEDEDMPQLLDVPATPAKAERMPEYQLDVTPDVSRAPIEQAEPDDTPVLMEEPEDFDVEDELDEPIQAKRDEPEPIPEQAPPAPEPAIPVSSAFVPERTPKPVPVQPPQITPPVVPGEQEKLAKAGADWAAALKREQQSARKHPLEEALEESQPKRARTVPEQMEEVGVAEESKPMEEVGVAEESQPMAEEEPSWKEHIAQQTAQATRRHAQKRAAIDKAGRDINADLRRLTTEQIAQQTADAKRGHLQKRAAIDKAGKDINADLRRLAAERMKQGPLPASPVRPAAKPLHIPTQTEADVRPEPKPKKKPYQMPRVVVPEETVAAASAAFLKDVKKAEAKSRRPGTAVSKAKRKRTTPDIDVLTRNLHRIGLAKPGVPPSQLAKELAAAKKRERVSQAPPGAPPPRKPELPAPVQRPLPKPKKKKRLAFSRPQGVSIPGVDKPTLTYSRPVVGASVRPAPKKRPRALAKSGKPRPMEISTPPRPRRRLTETGPRRVDVPSRKMDASPPPKPRLTEALQGRVTIFPKKTPKPTPPKPAPDSPPKRRARKARSPRSPRQRVGRGSAGRGSTGPTTIAPTQQVSVPVTSTSTVPGIGLLASKIDALLRAALEKKGKKAQRSGFNKARKEYKQLRNKRIAQVKTENKAIGKRERAKIKKLPTKDRPAARKKLNAALKERIKKVKAKLPVKAETPGVLSNLIRGLRTLKV